MKLNIVRDSEASFSKYFEGTTDLCYFMAISNRTPVRSLVMLVSDSLTDSCSVNLMPVNDASCLMMSQQLLKAVKRLSTLEMLLMLMMRIVLATVYCMLGS